MVASKCIQLCEYSGFGREVAEWCIFLYTTLLAHQISLQSEIFALPYFRYLCRHYPREIGRMGELLTRCLLARLLASSPSLQPSKLASLSGEALIRPLGEVTRMKEMWAQRDGMQEVLPRHYGF